LGRRSPGWTPIRTPWRTKISLHTPHRKTHDIRINDYEPIVGRSTLEELRLLATRLSGKVIQNINSTFSGGGVAEILSRMLPLLEQLGVDARWNTLKGNPTFSK